MGVIQERFNGRDRAHAKRMALQYWSSRRDSLGLTLQQFNRRCILLGDGSTIVFLAGSTQTSAAR